MDYFRILNLKKEPFSNSPDPAFFFQSGQHQGCLQKLELSLRMRRGLNVIIGDVGTGKTTLCRQLIQIFSEDDAVETHLILDPDFSSPTEFLTTISELFDGTGPPADADEWQIKERIKTHIFRQGVDLEKIIVLIIDEGQKIPVFCLEILREFLNYETNEYKLLQIVIFAQKEFDQTLKHQANFADRVNLYHQLGPLNFRDTRLMIRFRIEQAGNSSKVPSFFSYPALWTIYRATGGYPRKIINLCHQSVLAMIIQNRTRAGRMLVRSCMKRTLVQPFGARRGVPATVVLAILLIAVTVVGLWLRKSDIPLLWETGSAQTASLSTGPMLGKTQHYMVAPAKAEPASLVLESEPAARTVVSGKAGPDADVTRKTVSSAESSPPESIPVVEIDAERIDESMMDSITSPAILGSAALKRNETLSWMCVKVYGAYTRDILKALFAANPDMVNPNSLGEGHRVVFPATPVDVKLSPRPVWWVRIAKSDTLNDAFDVIRAYPVRKPPIRIIPHWNSREGAKFTVVLWGYFINEAAARNQLDRLPVSIEPEGTVFSQWGEGTIFFADPFLGGSR